MQSSLNELYDLFLKHPSVSTDSRQIETGCLFFALKGENFDGNIYANKAIESGAAYAIIDDPAYKGNQTILVENVLVALQQLALKHRRKFKVPVVAITGSNGKTTTKELINCVLNKKYKVTATKGNLNNHIGVPLTLLDINNETEIAIVEMGANHQGEIAQLCGIAEPTHGLITNIGRAHLGGFGGYEGVIKAKSELYTWLKSTDGEVFVNEGNQLLIELSSGIRRYSYGTEDGVLSKGRIKDTSGLLTIEWEMGNRIVEIETNLVGDYNFENVMAAICVGTIFSIQPDDIKSAICSYAPSNSRSQLMKTTRNVIILDAYNANPTSMTAAIENMNQLKAMHKMVILGDMLELGNESLAEHSAIAKLVEECDFNPVVLVGPDFMQVAHSIFTCFNTSDEARDWLSEQKIENYTILVKGSRGIKMEKVLDAL